MAHTPGGEFEIEGDVGAAPSAVADADRGPNGTAPTGADEFRLPARGAPVALEAQAPHHTRHAQGLPVPLEPDGAGHLAPQRAGDGVDLHDVREIQSSPLEHRQTGFRIGRVDPLPDPSAETARTPIPDREGPAIRPSALSFRLLDGDAEVHAEEGSHPEEWVAEPFRSNWSESPSHR